MGSYRKAKLAIDSFRNLASKIVNRGSPRVPIQNEANHQFKKCFSDHSFNNNSRVSGLSFFSLIRSKPSFQVVGRQNYQNPFFGGGRRYYYVDRYQVQHFKPRGPKRWFQNPRNVLVVVLLSSGVLITVYFGNLETIPYTKRKHFVLVSSDVERKLGASQFEKVKASFKGKILPAIHPDSIRVRLISKDIIEALQRGLRQEQVWSDPEYASESTEANLGRDKETLMALSGGVEGKMEGSWLREDEVLDDKWVQESRKKGHAKGSLPATQHLEGLIWEILVVDEPMVNAFCLPGGKIVVFTGLLDHFSTDTEIATIIGHEIGHVVARHGAEGITKNTWLAILQLILFQFVSTPDLVSMMSQLLLKLPFSRRMEMEADYIGLLLMASAGYDPRVAPLVYEKLGQVDGSANSELMNYLSTHPSGKKRAKLLREAKVMEEALAIYREAIAGRGVLGFL
ncbi:Peptidase M48 [Macleaya cordata]|uniref:Peptidase M48 n=1 Tax=Macleaya cordata TaxID=56857 RepID=A0A200PMQ6_MACCD|nr:Peptidase M48 [Macleaya cordata]